MEQHFLKKEPKVSTGSRRANCANSENVWQLQGKITFLSGGVEFDFFCINTYIHICCACQRSLVTHLLTCAFSPQSADTSDCSHPQSPGVNQLSMRAGRQREFLRPDRCEVWRARNSKIAISARV